MVDLPSRAVRFELLSSSGLKSPIFIAVVSFNSTAKAGDTLLANATSTLTLTYIAVPAPAIFIIRYEGKYFYTTIYNLYCLYLLYSYIIFSLANYYYKQHCVPYI